MRKQQLRVMYALHLTLFAGFGGSDRFSLEMVITEVYQEWRPIAIDVRVVICRGI